MKTIVFALCLGALSFQGSAAKTPVYHSEAKSNLRLTEHYYTQLIKTPQAHLAELTMLMTMLPKGGDIHHHYSGSIYAETYLDWVGQQGFCIYRENDPSKKQEKFRIETQELAAKNNPSCLKVEAIRKDIRFYRELLATWSALDFENHVHSQVPPDQHFFNSFAYFSPISKYSTNQGLRILKQQAKAENQQYLETMLRSAPITDHPEFSAKIDTLSSLSNKDELHQAFTQFANFLSEDTQAQKKINDYIREAENDVAGIDDESFSLRLQSYVSRNSSPSKVFSSLFAAFSASDAHPLFVGVNIVGPEHGYIALRDYALHMQMFAFLKQRFPKVRLSLHAGELVLGIAAPEHLHHHIQTAVHVAGAQRIGHGVGIMHETQADQLLAQLRARNVAIEINLTSNAFILGLKDQAHPITLYLRHQIPIVISSDDMGVSRNNLSHEYFLFTSRYQPSYTTLKKTVYNSISYSFLTKEEKQRQGQELDRRFLKFEAATAQLARKLLRKY
jgi:adenosine deaminase/adenosine deaminase CECR1